MNLIISICSNWKRDKSRNFNEISAYQANFHLGYWKISKLLQTMIHSFVDTNIAKISAYKEVLKKKKYENFSFFKNI